MRNKTICAATFISNTNNFHYPVELWREQLTGFDGIHIKNYPKNSVKIPADIATFQNETLKEVFEKGYDFCLFVQADIFFDSDKTDTMYDFAERSLKGHNHTFGIEDIKLYHYLYKHYFGVTLISKDSIKNFVGDGAYPESHNKRDDIIAGYSMGYMSKELFYTHKNSQSHVWKLVDYSELNNHPSCKKIPYEGVYKRIIDGLGVYEEYKKFNKSDTSDAHIYSKNLKVH
jgi:hypothetical protein